MARGFPYRRASAALDKQLSGGELTRQEALALRNLEQRLALTKPLSEYAPRTRRRYLAAAREGLTAQEANRREWQRRTESLTGDARRQEIERLRAAIYDSTVEEARDAHNPEDIAELIALYGEPFVLQLLLNQYNSIVAYGNGDKSAGHARWNNRADFMNRFRSRIELDEATDPYFYYHGTIG